MKRLDLVKTQLSGVSNFYIQNFTSNDFFKHVPLIERDAILGLSILFKADKDPKKVDLGVGAYRTDEGKPYLFNVVRTAEKLI